MKIVFAGSPDVAVSSLKSLLVAKFDVVGVLTRPPARTGRGRKQRETSVAMLARAEGIPVLETDNPSDPESIKVLEAWEPDLGIVVAYGALLRQNVLDIPRLGWINLHFSDLPRWRGAAPVQWAIRSGDTETATTVFQLERGLDTGPVFSRIPHELTGKETAGDLLDSLAEVGAQQILDVVRGLTEGSAVAIPQVGVPTRAPRLVKEDGYVDFAATADQVDRLIRSVTPNPGAWTRLPNGAVLRLGPVEVVPELEPSEPGRVHSTKKNVTVQCGSGAVQLGHVAPAGKKWMASADWLRGARWEDGSNLGGVK